MAASSSSRTINEVAKNVKNRVVDLYDKLKLQETQGTLKPKEIFDELFLIMKKGAREEQQALSKEEITD